MPEKITRDYVAYLMQERQNRGSRDPSEQAVGLAHWMSMAVHDGLVTAEEVQNALDVATSLSDSAKKGEVEL